MAVYVGTIVVSDLFGRGAILGDGTPSEGFGSKYWHLHTGLDDREVGCMINCEK